VGFGLSPSQWSPFAQGQRAMGKNPPGGGAGEPCLWNALRGGRVGDGFGGGLFFPEGRGKGGSPQEVQKKEETTVRDKRRGPTEEGGKEIRLILPGEREGEGFHGKKAAGKLEGKTLHNVKGERNKKKTRGKRQKKKRPA